MDIPQRYIKKLTRSNLPRKMIFFDCETKAELVNGKDLHKMYIAQSFYTERTNVNTDLRGKWKIHNDSEKLCEYIVSKAYPKSTLYLFAHNIFFDLQSIGFFKYLTLWEWELDFYYEKGMTYIMSIRKDDQIICALSTTNYFDTTAKNLGKMVDLPKLEIDFEEDTLEAITAYCKRDVEILIEAMKMYFDFLVRHDCGKFGLTKASQAMNLFRYKFLKNKIGIHTVEEIIDLERKAYIGGRTEAFRIGVLPTSDYISLDINSMYPFIMKTQSLPTKLIDYYKSPSIERVKELLEIHDLIIECEVKTKEACYAVRYNNKIIFPVGTFKAYLTTPGIKYAIEHEHLKSVSFVSIYQSDYIFKDYVDKLYPLKSIYKKENNEIFTKIVKIMLNSLYGKFGQRRPIMETTVDMTQTPYARMEVFDLVTGKHWMETHLMNVRYIEVGDEITNTTLTAIPAHITEYARFLLWDIIKQIGYENVLYCDTDSVKFERKYLKNVTYKIDDYEIGALGIDGEFAEFTINGAKDYKTNNECKIKGIPKSAKKIDDNTFKYTRFYKQSTHLREEISHGVMISEVTKVLRRIYNKAVVLPNGKTRPYRIPDDITLSE